MFLAGVLAVFAGAVLFEYALVDARQTWAQLPGVNGNDWVIDLTLSALAVSIVATVLRVRAHLLGLHLLKVSGLFALAATILAFTGLGYVGGGVILFAAAVLVGIALLGLSAGEREWKMVWVALAGEGCLMLGWLMLLFARVGAN